MAQVQRLSEQYKATCVARHAPRWARKAEAMRQATHTNQWKKTEQLATQLLRDIRQVETDFLETQLPGIYQRDLGWEQNERRTQAPFYFLQ